MNVRYPWSRVALAALVCMTGVACSAEAICPGSEGCVCQSAAACDDGLACSEGACQRPREIAISVDGAARACELIILDGDAVVAGVTVDDQVRGTHVREAPRTAVSFTARNDASIRNGSVRLRVIGAGEVRVDRARCFDSEGHLLLEANLRVRG